MPLAGASFLEHRVKHLLLLRHAKAQPAERGMADRDRSLTTRGHSDARLMGTAIAEIGVPDLILCSPARRTRETLEGVVETLAAEPKVVFVDRLYDSRDATYSDAIAANGGNANRLLVIAHNPTIHATAVALAAKGDRALRAAMSAKFPTCALAVIAFDSADWRLKAGELLAFRRPKDLGSEAED
jgi:phosphohistidine phosphatase